MARVDVLGQFTSDEILVVQAIEAGTYFVENGVPTGTIDGANDTFTLASAPNPTTSLEVYVNGQKQKLTTDYSVSSTTLTMVTAPEVGMVLTVSYRVSPV